MKLGVVETREESRMSFCTGCEREITGVIFNCPVCGDDFCIECWDETMDCCTGCAKEEAERDLPPDDYDDGEDNGILV